MPRRPLYLPYCSFADCSEKVQQKDKIHCSEHEKECPISSCSQRINNFQDYCPIHGDYEDYIKRVASLTQFLSEKDARQVLGSPDNFSIIRGNNCLEPNCQKEIGTCYQRCSDHKKLCQVRGCASDIRHLGDYCYVHLNANLKDCGLVGCSNQAINSEEYCSKHEWNCQYDYCSARIPYIPFGDKDAYYCSQHQNSVCQVNRCSQPKSSNGYCSNHYYCCQASGCSKRNSSNYCFDHGGICHQENCSQRIPRFEECCVVHQVRTCSKCSTRIGKAKERELWEISEAKEFCQRIDSLCSSCASDFLANTCEVLECENRVNRKQEKHCSAHAYQCNYWSGDWHCYDRTASSYGYCSSHNKSCLSCSAKIYKTEKYCSQHRDSCASCSNRVSYRKNYCNSCQQQKSEQTKLKSLVKANTTITGEIKEVERFSTDWNKNLATVIAENSNYWVFLLVLAENRKVKEFPVSRDCQWWGESKREQHSYLSSAQGEAQWLRGMLTSSSNPILLIHPSCNYNYASFNNLVSEPYVKIDYSASTSDFKPLDIVWVKKTNGLTGKDYYHVGIYLGNSDILHFCDPDALFSTNNMKVRITGWSTFLNGRTGSIRRYHPVIPFKDYKKIIEQALKSDWANYGSGRYDLANHNCEHVVNSLVLGMDYSSQIGNRKGELIALNILRLTSPLWTIIQTIRGDWRINNGKGNTINLLREINSYETNGRFDNLTSSELREKRDNYERQYRAQIVAPVKTSDCVIM